MHDFDLALCAIEENNVWNLVRIPSYMVANVGDAVKLTGHHLLFRVMNVCRFFDDAALALIEDAYEPANLEMLFKPYLTEVTGNA